MNIHYVVAEKSCWARYLNPANHHLAGIRKDDNGFTKTLDFKETKFQIKLRDIR